MAKDITWYIKWFASFILLVGISIRSINIHSAMSLHILDLVCSWAGALGWFYVGCKWNERAMIFINGIMVAMTTSSLFKLFIS